MNHKSILLIEDDPALRENTAELLELSNYQVHTAPNGKAGIELVHQEKPDLIICDIMMPEIDGYGVLKAMNSNPDFAHIPFIFLSAKTEHTEIRKGMNLGADDYLTKPFTETELLEAIESRLLKTEILLNAFQQENKVTEKGDIRNLNELKTFFEDYGERTKLKKGEYVYEVGDRANNIYLVTKGAIKCFKIDINGKELITELVNEDNFLGFTPLQNYAPYTESGMAVKDAEVIAITKSILRELLGKNQNISIELMNVITDNVYKIKEQLLQMAYSSVRKKTAQTLLQFAKTIGKGNQKISIKASRSDLASVAGIATESLIRMLSNFKKEGLIDINGREIVILNLEKLDSIE